MAQHLSVRIPWKDNGYNGFICKKPCFNNACIRLKNIAGAKNDDFETEFAGKSVKGHENEIPCVNEGGCFMSEDTYVITTVHPYTKTSPGTHGHFTETELVYPPFSFPARPYAWTMLNKSGQYNDDNMKELIEKYDIGFDPAKEPVLYFTTNWAQDAENQRTIFKSFYENIEPNKSLMIPYAKQVPFVDDAKRIVMGIGYITSITEPPEYNYSEKKKVRSILWETMLGHSIRDDRKNGFLMPYREMMEYAKEHPDFDIKSITVFADDEYFDEFSYATEHVSYDAVISVLLKVIKSLEIIKKCIPGNWNECINWTKERLNEVWIDRGVFPGFASMLYAIGLKHQYVLSNEIKKHIEDESEFEIKVEEILSHPEKNLSERTLGFINKTVVDAFLGLSKERKDLFWLLSRMTLSELQATTIFNPEERKHIGIDITNDSEILDNPYIIYERTCNLSQEYIVSAKKIDMAVFQPEIIRNINPLKEPTSIGSENDKRRIRAYVVSQLEEEALQGHTIYPVDFLVKNINNLPIEPECHVSGDIMNGIQGFLEGEISVITCEDGSLAYQLNRLKAYDDIIRKSIGKRIKDTSPRHTVNEDWGKLVDEEFERKGLQNFKSKEFAKQERVEILKELAESQLSVLIGGAGTGKTTLLSLLCKSPEIYNGDILLLAPTGKARVRMVQAMKEHDVNCKAKTVAQFLSESGRYNGYTMQYTLSEKEAENIPFTVIIDESSMLTEEMFGALIQALRKKAKRIIFVGDPNQLPPIGAGRPFVDLVQHLNEKIDGFPKVGRGFGELTVNMRQLANDEEMREDTELAKWYTDNPSDLDESIFTDLQAGKLGNRVEFKKWETPEELEQCIFAVVKEVSGMSGIDDVEGFNLALGGEISSGWMNFGSKPHAVEDWQILSAYRNDAEIGTSTINRYIHEKYRSKDGMTMQNSQIRKTKFPLGTDGIVYGDKVINIRNQRSVGYPKSPENNYVANGEVGIVENLKYRNKEKNIKSNSHQIRFSSQPNCVYYWDSKVPEEGNSDLELAYALTVHKSQGSEFKTAILVISEPSRMLSKELLYTAITRQKDKLVILYNDSAVKLRDYADVSCSEVAKRLTCLFKAPDIKEYKGKYYEKSLIHMTLKGELVRSKSEVIIANMLYDAGLKEYYEYEKALDLGEDGKYIPDFTIEDPESGIKYYWEHCGMLGDYCYSKRWSEKKKVYAKHGIVEGDNLFVTKDSLNGAIDSKEIKKIIDMLKEELE